MSTSDLVRPWLRVTDDYQGEMTNEILELYMPYGRAADRHQPSLLIVIGWEHCWDAGAFGMDTSLHEFGGEKTMCIILRLGSNRRPRNLHWPLKTRKLVDHGDSNQLLRRACLLLSDVICIIAKNESEAASEILRLVTSQPPDLERDLPHFIVMIKEDPDLIFAMDAQTNTAEFRDFLISQWEMMNGDQDGHRRHSHRFRKIIQNIKFWSYCPRGSYSLADLCRQFQELLRAKREKRRRMLHLWTIKELNFLLEAYTNTDPNLLWSGTSCFPVIFRKQFWPGSDMKDRNSLVQWLCAGGEDYRVIVHLARVFAWLFLQDGRSLMHRLPPRELFLSLYKPLCVDAWRKAATTQPWIVQENKNAFMEAVLLNMTRWSPALEKETQLWMKIITDQPFCCSCIWDLKPLIYFACGHGICERDAWIYSTRKSRFDCLSYFHSCPVCGTPEDKHVRLRPLQAGYRVATFDGGGVRGIVSLVALERVLHGLPTQLVPHQYFDLIVGTSTGSIISVALGLMKWPLPDVIQAFRSMAGEVFRKEEGLTGLITMLVRLCWKGAKYDGSALYRALQKILESRPIRGTEEPHAPEVVHLVIPTTDSKAGLCLFRSYAATVYPNPPIGVKDAGFEKSLESPPVWQVVAASCAAPPYFPPVEIRHIGKLQDGAFAANNPNWVMLRELSSISMVRNRCLDFVSSFGTGWFSALDPDKRRGLLGLLVPEWTERVSHCLLQGLDAAEQYRHSFDSLKEDEQKRHHRIDPFLGKSPVALDSVGAIDQLEQLTRARFGTVLAPGGRPTKASAHCVNKWRQRGSPPSDIKLKSKPEGKRASLHRRKLQTKPDFRQFPQRTGPSKIVVQHITFDLSREVEKLRLAMLATAFYALLLSPPQYDTQSGRYLATLGIASRWEEDVAITSSLKNLLRLSSFRVQIRDQRHYFACRTPLECSVAIEDLDDPNFDIRLKHSDQESHSISGFPMSISQLMHLQGPHSFGLSTSLGKRKRFSKKQFAL